ncbi:DUF2470 domain-containing protein [Paractinoplanes rishiriensis]|uniref:DUF2470 domain-containing protein n=1 Tax=Paractinoplanes rishiriensis TaxID=1050105 RepID=A0A919JY78_9ACTN|nr:DUF2470 domain-containing protein [Actinoplanes rishiriensis]GIE96928.1 hypothetical protein Ari01nite_43930 [Actinoplanes rishiriensis]
MQPTHAEVARTLAAGHLPAVAHIACRPGPLPVRHVTDAQGRVLLLSPSDGAFAAALAPQPGAEPTRGGKPQINPYDDTAMVLDITDVPPMAGSPALGRVWVSGWATRLDGDEAKQAAMDYAEIDASGDLLDVGGSKVLHRMDVAEVRYERNEKLVDVDPDDFAAAAPDPLRQIEFDLIADLADHHLAEMSAYVRRQLGSTFQPRAEPQVVRMDRYGFMVRLDDKLARLAFPRPVTDRQDLAHLLHPVLCHRCAD